MDINGRSDNDLHQLFDLYYHNSTVKSKQHEVRKVLDKCIRLFDRDYPLHVIINNQNGFLSSSYPSKIFVPQRIIDGKETLNADYLNTLISKARIARCRARFPVPVILYNNKYICRSATLSGGPEIYGRTLGLDLLFINNNSDKSEDSKNFKTNESPIFDSNQVFTYARKQDIILLNYFSVKLICDLMVEYKKVKFWFNVTSSEKADKRDRYEDFSILLLPYPGCEFFRRIKLKDYKADGVTYDWNQGFVDSKLYIPEDKIPKDLKIDWKGYESWDILTLTKNYLKLLLLCLKKNDDSMLIHCISGWDRTPLFISLLRISLWADGLIHESLNAKEITYLTLAYDWYLFGHNLSDRISKGEDILFFCFYFLIYIENQEFSLSECPEGGLKDSQHNLREDNCDPFIKKTIYGTNEIDSNNDEARLLNKDESEEEDKDDISKLNFIYASSWSLASNSSSTSRKQVEIEDKNVCNLSAQSKPVEIPNRSITERSASCSSRSDSWILVSTNSIGETSSVKMLYNSPISKELISSKSNLKSNSNTERVSINSRKSKLDEVRKYFFEAYSSVVFDSNNKVSSDTMSYLTKHFTGTTSSSMTA